MKFCILVRYRLKRWRSDLDRERFCVVCFDWKNPYSWHKKVDKWCPTKDAAVRYIEREGLVRLTQEDEKNFPKLVLSEDVVGCAEGLLRGTVPLYAYNDMVKDCGITMKPEIVALLCHKLVSWSEIKRTCAQLTGILS